MANTKKTGLSYNMPNKSSEIKPIDDPDGAIDFFMPLPDEIYRKWK